MPRENPTSFEPNRRAFLHALGGAAGAAWAEANWPGLLAAAQHAHQAVKEGSQSYLVLTAEEARELDALTACILPSDDLPGAREAGVVHFIDHALSSFAKDDLPKYRAGIPEIQKAAAKMFPGVTSFSAATPEQQGKILEVVAGGPNKPTFTALGLPKSGEFFQTLRVHTISGFLVVPDGGGNREYAGWKVIGRDPEHSFSPPFGFYDKDYPGWQSAESAATEKK